MSVKRKMGREGTHTDAQIRKILEEGQALAKVKLNALMQESLEEKASTSDIKSPAFRLAHKKYKNAISGKTSMLVSDGTIGGNKDNDAKKLGVRTVSPEVFRELLKFVQPKSVDG